MITDTTTLKSGLFKRLLSLRNHRVEKTLKDKKRNRKTKIARKEKKKELEGD